MKITLGPKHLILCCLFVLVVVFISSVASKRRSVVVHINVGGQRFTTSVNTLQGASFFQNLDHLPRDGDGNIFVDRDPDLFRHVLTYLRTGRVFLQEWDKSLRERLYYESEYYQVYELQQELRQSQQFPDSTILSSEHQKQLNEWTWTGNDNQQWRLIHRSSRDGFLQTYNNQQGYIIVKANGNNIFGCYNAIGPRSTPNKDQAFLFTLSNPFNIPPTKYVRNINPEVPHHIMDKQPEPDMNRYDNGEEQEGELQENRNAKKYAQPYDEDDISINGNQGTIRFPRLYLDTTGRGFQTFTGSSNFNADEIEIWQKQ